VLVSDCNYCKNANTDRGSEDDRWNRISVVVDDALRKTLGESVCVGQIAQNSANENKKYLFSIVKVMCDKHGHKHPELINSEAAKRFTSYILSLPSLRYRDSQDLFASI
jgi:hypothetical protein